MIVYQATLDQEIYLYYRWKNQGCVQLVGILSTLIVYDLVSDVKSYDEEENLGLLRSQEMSQIWLNRQAVKQNNKIHFLYLYK